MLRTSTALDIQIKTLDTKEQEGVRALLDSGATGCFIDLSFVKQKRWVTRKLARRILVYNINSTTNQIGAIKEELDILMSFKGHMECLTLLVTGLGTKMVVIGHNWLAKHNPEIDWTTGNIQMLRCPTQCNLHQNQAARERKKDQKACKNFDMFYTELAEEFEEVRASLTPSQRMLQEYGGEEGSSELPQWCADFADVFSEEGFQELPPHRPWDHAINLKPDFKPTAGKIYPLSRPEQIELERFLDKKIKSGHIRPSKSPQAAPFFFVSKCDGKLHPVQDYCKLNDQTIKDKYPLPLISEVLRKLRGAKYFSKFDVRWCYGSV